MSFSLNVCIRIGWRPSVWSPKHPRESLPFSQFMERPSLWAFSLSVFNHTLKLSVSYSRGDPWSTTLLSSHSQSLIPHRQSIIQFSYNCYVLLQNPVQLQLTNPLCYTTTSDRLWQGFQHLESLKLKNNSRTMMFNLISDDWWGYVLPWVREIADSFHRLTCLHFRQMIVRDSNLELLAEMSEHVFQVLKLEKCLRFSTDGLFHINHSYR